MKGNAVICSKGLISPSMLASDRSGRYLAIIGVWRRPRILGIGPSVLSLLQLSTDTGLITTGAENLDHLQGLRHSSFAVEPLVMNLRCNE